MLQEQNRQTGQAEMALDLVQGMICTLDCTILFWSPGMVRLVGWSEQEAVGNRCRDLFESELPQSRAEIERQVLETGHWQGTCKLKHRDGRAISAAVHWAIYREEESQPPRVLKTFVETGNPDQSLGVEHLADSFLMLDNEFRIRYINCEAERLLGNNREALCGKCIWEEYPATLGTQVEHEYRKSMRERTKSHFEVFYEPWQRWFDINVSPDRGGGLGVHLQDITDQKRFEEVSVASEGALRTLAGALFSNHDQERRVISWELHERLNQELATLQMDLSLLENTPMLGKDVQMQIHAVGNRVGKLADALHRIASDLHPSILDHLGLEVAMRAYITEFASREGLRCKFLTRNAPQSLSPEMGICLYRVLQEALENAARHGKPQRITVHLSTNANELVLSVRDDGVGFIPEAAIDKRTLGLIRMEGRVKLMRGEYSLKSRPGFGTLIEARIPLEPHNPAKSRTAGI